MSTSVAIANVRSQSETGSLMAATVGFYFAFRYSIEYLFFQSNPRAGAGFGVGLNLLLFAVVAFHSLGPAPSTLRSTVLCALLPPGHRLSPVRSLQLALERDDLGIRRFCLLVRCGG